MPDFQTLDDVAVNGKRVLLRGDLNVPMKNGRVADTTRLERLIPTIRELQKAGAKILILSHFGRPKGGPDEAFSLKPVAAELGTLLAQPIAFAPDCVGPEAETVAAALQPGQVAVLENTRFYPEEEANDPAFADRLAALGDFYVNDAFSAAHRAHASTEALAARLPSAAGRLMQAELEALAKALERPERPLMAIVGGSKISTKIDLLHNLVAKVDVLLPGGGMANTFLAAKGFPVGASLYEPDMLETARAIMDAADKRGGAVLLPTDVVVAPSLEAIASARTVAVRDVQAGDRILDLGPATVAMIKDTLSMVKTLVWNGPLGVFETPPFDAATNEVSIAVADLTKRGKMLSVAGGGDTVAALINAGTDRGFGYLSTAGGAFLEWLEGKELPGVAALKKAVPKAKTARAIL